MAKITDKNTGQVYDSDDLVSDFIETQPTEDQKTLFAEYVSGYDATAWVEEFLLKYKIKTPNGNDYFCDTPTGDFDKNVKLKALKEKIKDKDKDKIV